MPEQSVSPAAGTYPVMLDVRDKTCLIVGGGTVAQRKLTGLLHAGASITLISPFILETIQQHVSQGEVHWVQSEYAPGMLAEYDPFLVIAAADSSHTNDQVADDAQRIGVLVNTTHKPALGNFSNMAVIRRQSMTIGLHTGGMSPALTQHLKNAINAVIGDEYITLSQWLGEERGLIRERISPQSRRQELYQAVLRSDILGLLRGGETTAALQRLRELIVSWIRE
jgi:precorrin-2 dehydrogenase/sirohydrochlorin ferrochelatase